ncbi:hypothetical protein [uncultured Herbaspirillum sp.]|jgi:hypothetical protein|uniref:hypothetical protein n=1 Tax=uncultured Herbaspirillum sp. TaxID=160236 RepID=UPI002582CA1F|nr:hypothetical protein [uncultured Herbaspirillum sp.]
MTTSIEMNLDFDGAFLSRLASLKPLLDDSHPWRDVSLGLPIPLYLAKLNITASSFTATQAGWCAVLFSADEPVATVDVEMTEEKQANRLFSLSGSSAARRLWRAIDMAEEIRRLLSDRHYVDRLANIRRLAEFSELRLIDFPSIHVSALWLYSQRHLSLFVLLPDENDQEELDVISRGELLNLVQTRFDESQAGASISALDLLRDELSGRGRRFSSNDEPEEVSDEQAPSNEIPKRHTGIFRKRSRI